MQPSAVTTCQHFLNGEYSVSIFDNGDIMCKYCAGERIGGRGDKFVAADPRELYRHLCEIYRNKSGGYDTDYPSNYKAVLANLGINPDPTAKSMRRAGGET